MQGKIIRGVGGFYYVHISKLGILECKAKGVFRNRKIKPLVGDDVEVEVLDEENRLGNITDIMPRHSELVRPAVANVDQAVVIFAVSYPKPNFNLLDRFLLMMEWQDVPVRICFNKMDTADEDFVRELKDIYQGSGAEVFFTSTYSKEGLDLLHDHLIHKTTVLAGPSGVGKSSVMNAIFPEAEMEIGEISTKIKRGKHTTRHSELFSLSEHTYVMDTPGFTSLSLPDIDKEQLGNYYAEFEPYIGHCRFQGCAHVNEPDCAVKDALGQGKISENRYKNYTSFYEELRQRKRY